MRTVSLGVIMFHKLRVDVLAGVLSTNEIDSDCICTSAIDPPQFAMARPQQGGNEGARASHGR